MGFKQWINKVFSGGAPHIEGGDAEGNAILREEYGTDPLEEQAGGSPIGGGPAAGPQVGGYVGLEDEMATEDAERATDKPADQAP